MSCVHASGIRELDTWQIVSILIHNLNFNGVKLPNRHRTIKQSLFFHVAH